MVSPRAAIAPVVMAALPLLGSLVLAAPKVAPDVTVEGTQFRITRADGTVMPQTALPGVVLAIGDGSGRQRQLRIDAVEVDPKDPAGEVVLYSFSERDAQSGEWHNACLPDPEGRRMGFPLAGAFTAEMQHVDRPGRFAITCTGGAEGKCVRFGYKPWRSAPDGTPLAPYYQTCVRLVRADYLGDGVGNTRNGTPIVIFDKIGIRADGPAPGMTLEAAWGPDGAVCVRHTRLQDVLSTAALAERSPQLVRESCDESAPDALLFNRSLPQ